MRLRGAGAHARLLLAFLILIGSFVTNPQPPGATPAASVRAAAAKRNRHHAKHDQRCRKAT